MLFLLIFKDVDRFKLSLEVVTWMTEEGRNCRTDRMRKKNKSEKTLGRKLRKREDSGVRSGYFMLKGM